MREWKEKLGAMRHYDRQSTIYDAQYEVEQNTKIEYTFKNMKFDSNEIVLDLGCGTGLLFKYINKKVGLLVGIDIALNALEEAKKWIKNTTNIAIIRADADNTPFPDHIFNKVIAITVLQNMPDPTKTMIEMKRIGKTEAIFAVTGLKKKFKKESFIKLLELVHLKILTLNTNNKLNDIMAICSNN